MAAVGDVQGLGPMPADIKSHINKCGKIVMVALAVLSVTAILMTAIPGGPIPFGNNSACLLTLFIGGGVLILEPAIVLSQLHTGYTEEKEWKAADRRIQCALQRRGQRDAELKLFISEMAPLDFKLRTEVKTHIINKALALIQSEQIRHDAITVMFNNNIVVTQ